MKMKNWKKGRGKLGLLDPLLGNWTATTDSPMGKLVCTRSFSKLGDQYIELHAEWKMPKGNYIEKAIIGIENDQIHFWSFTSDGKRSEGNFADGTDVHPEGICFEAKMPAGIARMIYWPADDDGMMWAVEAKNKKGWKRFTEHHYHKIT